MTPTINLCGQCGEFALSNLVLATRHRLGGYVVACFSGDCGNSSEPHAREEDAIAEWNNHNPDNRVAHGAGVSGEQ